MIDVEIIRDMDDDPDGNVVHIAEHDFAKEVVESVLSDPDSEATSDSSGRPIVFGWTATDRSIAAVHEEVMDDPRIIYPITAFVVEPPSRRSGT